MFFGRALILIAAFGSAMALSATPAEAKRHRRPTVKLRPDWASAQQVARTPNLSYLSSVNPTRFRAREVEMLDRVFEDPVVSREFRHRFERLQSEYESRDVSAYGAVNAERQYLERVARLRDEAMRKFQADLGRRQGRRLTRRLKNEGAIEKIGTPGQVLAAAAGLSLGRPLRLRFGDSAQLFWRSQIQRRTGTVLLRHQLFDSQVDYWGRNADTLDGFSAQDLAWFNPDGRPERYRVKVSRHVPFFDLDSAVIYGGTTQMVSASLTKRFTDEVSAEFSTSRATVGDPRTRGIEQEAVKLLYSLRF
jgi:hypothetical protein